MRRALKDILTTRFPSAQIITPTTDSGWATYLNGMRLFLPAATNYCTNPSFELATDGLANGWDLTASNVTGTVVTTQVTALTGTGLYAQRIQYTGVAGDASGKTLVLRTDLIADMTPGDIVTLSYYITGSLVSCSAMTLYLSCYTAANAFVANVITEVIVPPGSVVRQAFTSSALPATTARVRVQLYVTGVVENSTIDITIDDVLIEKSSILTPYFDGSYPDCVWTGTANASTSTRTGSDLRYSPGFLGPTLTLAMRCVPLWAGNDGQGHALFETENSNLVLYKRAATSDWRAIVGGSFTVESAALSFAAGSSHVLVWRFNCPVGAGDTEDLNYDGVNAAQTAVPADLTFTLPFGLGDAIAGTLPTYAYIGPVLISPVRKSDAWTTAIQANSGAAYNSPTWLWKHFMSAGDLLISLTQDGRAYLKTSGRGQIA